MGGARGPSWPLRSDEIDWQGDSPAELIGKQLGQAQRAANVSTTNTVFGDVAATSKITDLIVADVLGIGRPVDVRLVVPSVRHSAADMSVAGNPVPKQVGYYLIVNGVVAAPLTQAAFEWTWDEATGCTHRLEHDVVLDDGVLYDIEVGWYSASGAGTVSALLDPLFPARLTVVQR